MADRQSAHSMPYLSYPGTDLPEGIRGLLTPSAETIEGKHEASMKTVLKLLPMAAVALLFPRLYQKATYLEGRVLLLLDPCL